MAASPDYSASDDDTASDDPGPADSALAELLPGSWTVAATNFPMWVSGERRHPRFTYRLLSRTPLVLSDDVSYAEGGIDKHIRGRDTLRGDGFVWRGRGLLAIATSRWSVAGRSEDGTVVTIRFSRSLATPAGLDVIVREGTEHAELRAMIARSTEGFGLTPEDFASLSWLRR